MRITFYGESTQIYGEIPKIMKMMKYHLKFRAVWWQNMLMNIIKKMMEKNPYSLLKPDSVSKKYSFWIIVTKNGLYWEIATKMKHQPFLYEKTSWQSNSNIVHSLRIRLFFFVCDAKIRIFIFTCCHKWNEHGWNKVAAAIQITKLMKWAWWMSKNKSKIINSTSEEIQCQRIFVFLS